MGGSRACILFPPEEWRDGHGCPGRPADGARCARTSRHCRDRVWEYYLPVYGWVCAQLEQHRASGKSGPLVVGISAVQGCGKSTLCEALQVALEAEGLKAASLSIDDFYLPHNQLTEGETVGGPGQEPGQAWLRGTGAGEERGLGNLTPHLP